jgi:hypothetical protein
VRVRVRVRAIELKMERVHQVLLFVSADFQTSQRAGHVRFKGRLFHFTLNVIIFLFFFFDRVFH